MGWKSRSMGTFERKIGVDLCHIVAKTPFSAVPAAGLRTDVFHYQTFLIFSYLRAKARAVENNRFSVLKNSGADRVKGARGRARSALRRGKAPHRHLSSSAREIHHVETRFIASHPLGARPRTDILASGRQECRPSYDRHPPLRHKTQRDAYFMRLFVCVQARCVTGRATIRG